MPPLTPLEPLRRSRSSSRRKRTILIPWERPPAWFGWAIGRRGLTALILTLLTLFAVLALRHQRHIERVRITRVTMAGMQRATVGFKIDHGRCPSGIRELVYPPSGQPLLAEIPLDAWGRWFSYRCPGRKNPESADVRSRGPNGTWWGRDEVD